MSMLFKPGTIGNLNIKNRFVRSATHDNTCDAKGFVTEKTLEIYRDVARGQVGLIITGHAYVDERGIPSFSMMGIDNEDKVEGLSKIVNAVHAAGSLVFVQINHGGRNTRPDLANGDIFAPSAVPHRVFRNIPKALSKNQIQELIDKFAQATLRAKQAGFDGVQFHAAHGYLISQFHSPFTNKRKDEFGGSLENRTRFLHNIVKASRNLVGKDYPLIMKVNSQDFLKDGFSLEDSSWLAGMAADFGLDAIEISGGVMESQSKITKRKIATEDEEAYFKEAAELYKTKTSLPIILVGGLRSLSIMDLLLEGKISDFISLCRPLIHDPSFVKKLMDGTVDKSDCMSCSKCMNPENSYLQCVNVK